MDKALKIASLIAVLILGAFAFAQDIHCGYDVIGATTPLGANAESCTVPCTTAVTTTIGQCFVYMNFSASISANCALYDNAGVGGAPKNLICEQHKGISTAGPSWYPFTLSGCPATLPPGTYHTCFNQDSPTTLYHDTGATRWYDITSCCIPPNPFSISGSNNEEYSAYVVLTPVGAATKTGILPPMMGR